MKQAITTALILTIFLSPQSFAGKNYDLSSLEPEVGQVVESTSKMVSEEGTLKLVVGRKVLAEGTLDSSRSSTTRKTITKVEGGVVIEYTTLMTASEENIVTTIGGNATKKNDPSVLLNEEVTWKLVDDEYVPNLPDATPAQLEELKPDLNHDHDIYPSDPVPVGHSWKLSREAIADYVDAPLSDDFKSEGSFEFLAVEDYKGEPCAKLKIKITLSGKMPKEELDEGMEEGTMKMSLEGIIYRSLKDRVDVGGEIEGQGKGVMLGSDPKGNAFTVIYESPLEMTGSAQRIK